MWQPISIGSAATRLTYTVDEDDAGKPLRAEVSYFDRRNADRDLFNRKEVTSGETSPVEADPLANVPPRFRSGTTLSIEEGPSGRTVGQLMATDRDGDTLTFGMQAGRDSAFFEVNPSTGVVRAILPLDFEQATGGLFTFTATLSDGKAVDPSDLVILDDSVDVHHRRRRQDHRPGGGGRHYVLAAGAGDGDAADGDPDRRRRRRHRRELAVGAVGGRTERLEPHLRRDQQQLHAGRERRGLLPARQG